MKNKEEAKLYVVVAPSGAGKSTLVSKIRSDFPSVGWSVSHTSREKRSGEVHGEDYFYISKQDFEEKIKERFFLEWALVHDQYKGTSRSFIQESLKKGQSLLLELDVQGADEVKEIFPSSIVIFIAPPSFEELERRLRSRKTDSEEQIDIRLNNARKEMSQKDDYDFLIINDDLEIAYQKMYSIFEKQGAKP